MRNFLFFGLILLCIPYTTESERFLKKQLSEDNFDFIDLKAKSSTIHYNITNSGVQYGIITLNNKQEIKFWFVSHHFMSDKGGTIYEFPNGDKQFISGMYCCEVQFNDDGSLKNLSTFKNYLEAKNGLRT
ncbi:hypothetical protein [Paenimyroides baculatum]|uniref:Uncharacterized protein n=1 Tax=Paenimyroides baculatum TaxID=2608000 RepID=A0A5M6CFE1_9FLAO|nr:hypothetical protein [Paenimyroides baculatum]KAA5531829.1 hypothetical protein F0460_14520 [Paenimyroides baculatum]